MELSINSFHIGAAFAAKVCTLRSFFLARHLAESLKAFFLFIYTVCVCIYSTCVCVYIYACTYVCISSSVLSRGNSAAFITVALWRRPEKLRRRLLPRRGRLPGFSSGLISF